MPEETKESKAQKLAAARKKLKEYQRRNADPTGSGGVAGGDVASNASLSTSSNLSERSDSELHLNGHEVMAAFEPSTSATPTQGYTVEQPATAASYFGGAPAVSIDFPATVEVSPMEAPLAADMVVPAVEPPFVAAPAIAPMAAATSEPAFAAPQFNPFGSAPLAPLNQAALQGYPMFASPTEPLRPSPLVAEETIPNLNALQVLIAEKGELTVELNKYRSLCREKDLEMEELRTQFKMSSQRTEDVSQRFLEQQKTAELLRNINAELQHKLAQMRAHSEDQETHLEELKKELSFEHAKVTELDQQNKEKCHELEMAQIRIRQLSDEGSVCNDNRVETLTQTQFMYEQQIRDLQAMVQQLTQDKEQANVQYQTYVQHLNAQVASFTEKNAELTTQCAKLQEREAQLIEHVGGLEREIQKNISRQDQLREERRQESPAANSGELAQEVELLKEKINDFDFERHEFQLKIKSQEDRLESCQAQLVEKEAALEEFRNHLEQLTADRPDTAKLMAVMESDKVAASRALTQNVELKKQVDELEQRFVQLTNEKADLMTKLDAESYAHRTILAKYEEINGNIRNFDERFKFKDEEMIRLSHETVKLERENLVLQQQLDQLQHFQAANSVKKSNKKSRKPALREGEEPHDEPEHPNDEHHGHEHHHHEHHDVHHHGEHQHDEHQHDAHHHGEHLHEQHHHDEHGHDAHHHHHHDESDHHNHAHSSHQHPDVLGEKHSESDSCQEAHETTPLARATIVYTPSHEASEEEEEDEHLATPFLPTAEAVERLQQRFTKLMSQVADLTDEKQRLEHLVLQLQGETETIGEYVALYQTQRRMLKQREYEKAAQMQYLQTERTQLREKISMLNQLVESLGLQLPPMANYAAPLPAPTPIEPQLAESPSEQPLPQPAGGAVNEALMRTVVNEKLNSSDSQQIITKIQSIITDIKENAMDVPQATHTADHLKCCMGKFEVV